jgi:hypothetical protein
MLNEKSMETKKLTQEELNQISLLREKFRDAYANIGLVTIRIKELEAEKQLAENRILELNEEELGLYEKLKSSYGEGVVDLVTGEFKQNQ